MLRTSKTQLPHRLRLRKFTPQAPLVDIFVRESVWQKDDQMLVAHDDLFAQSWNTNFGRNPFEDRPPDYTQYTDDIQYVPIEITEKTHPPSLKFPTSSGGSAVEQTTESEAGDHNENPLEIHDDETEISPKKIKRKYTRNTNTKNP